MSDDRPTRVEADVCIVGAGPAGIALARELVGLSLRIVVLESGSDAEDAATDDLSRGSVISRHYPADALERGRRRQVGGTSNLWVYRGEPDDGRRYARSLPPEPIDFGAADAGPDLAWPFAMSTIIGHYERAQRLWNGAPFAYDVSDWPSTGRSPITSPNGVLRTQICQHGSADVFRQRYRDELLEAENVSLHTGTTVVGLEMSTRTAVGGVSAVRADGSSLNVAARCVVLAAGGVENVQLLLNSEHGMPGGAANRHDVVGRYVTAHPEVRIATLLPSDDGFLDRLGLYDLWWAGTQLVSGYLTLADEVKAREGLLNASGVLVPLEAGFGLEVDRSIATTLAVRRGHRPPGYGRHARALVASPRELLRRVRNRRRTFWDYHGGWSGSSPVRERLTRMEVYLLSEQTAERDNRIELSEARDRLGRRRPRLTWRWSDSDKRSLVRSASILVDELEDAGLGPSRRWLDLDGADRPFFDGWHHPMGGTRMHVDPRWGVVDEHSRVHGVGNLYVAGSSVFPMSNGSANPTLTILALTLRLADHLKDTLG